MHRNTLCTNLIAVKWCLDNSISGQVTTPVKLPDLVSALLAALESNNVTTAATENSITYRILIAEDNMVNQKLAVKMLEKYSHTVDIAENGQAAVDSYVSRYEAGEPYDVILVSVMYSCAAGVVTDQMCRWTCPCRSWAVWKLRSTSGDTRARGTCLMFPSSH